MAVGPSDRDDDRWYDILGDRDPLVLTEVVLDRVESLVLLLCLEEDPMFPLIPMDLPNWDHHLLLNRKFLVPL